MSFSQQKYPIAFRLILPGLYLVAALYVDFLTPLGVITPFFVVVGMLVMALNYRPVVMIPWAIIYTVAILTIFLVPGFFIIFAGHPYREPYGMQLVRSATYLVVGILASYLCISLNRVRRSANELTHILGNIPWPILTSDQNGKILYCNAPAKVLLPELALRDGQINYFDLLAPPEFHGKTITAYLNLFEGEHRRDALKLTVQGQPYQGHVRMISWTNQKVLLTILAEREMTSSII